MPLRKISRQLIRRAENRIGVKLDYVHEIARTDFSLLLRYNKIFSFLDPNKNATKLAYHTARLRGAIAADCGTCVEVERNLAAQSGVAEEVIAAIIMKNYDQLPPEIAAVARLADAVVGQRIDDEAARNTVKSAFGESGFIEICYAMNGAALLPGIKRAMGYATACDISLVRK